MRPVGRCERTEVDEGTIELVDRSHRRSHQADDAVPNGLEHRLNVGRRATDDAQNFSRRSLLLQRLAQCKLQIFIGWYYGQTIVEALQRPTALQAKLRLG